MIIWLFIPIYNGGTHFQVLSGVPQGTVLGPLLFLVPLSDISKDINHSSVVSFADDTRVFRQIIDINDCSLLQNDLDNIYSWASVNNMVFNDSKFQHMSYHHQLQHRSCNHIYLSPSMNIINSNNHTRDLGITMSGDCSFNESINLRTKQCRQLTGWILRTFKSRDKCTMVALFKSLVLPRLEYGCQLWSPTSVNQINAIENIQRKFTKHITVICITTNNVPIVCDSETSKHCSICPSSVPQCAMGIQDDPMILKNGNCNQKKVNCATFNFIYLNVAHLLKNSTQNRSKINLLNHVVDSNCLFLGLTETHLNEKILDNEINIDKFNIVRCDRLIRQGGGVCLYVNQSAQFSMCVSYSNQTCESLIVKIHSPEIYVIIMYRPPDCELSEFEDVLNILISWIRSLSSPLPDIFLMGDFNFPSHDWAHNQLISSSNQVSILLNASDSLFLEQMVTVPTRKNNILDLVFASHDLIDTISVQNTAISDHNIIYVELNLPTETNSSAACNRSAKNPPKNCFESLNFNKADFVEINSKLELVNWPILLNNNSAIECFKLFSMVLSSICLECVPKKSSSTIHKNSFYKKKTSNDAKTYKDQQNDYFYEQFKNRETFERTSRN